MNQGSFICVLFVCLSISFSGVQAQGGFLASHCSKHCCDSPNTWPRRPIPCDIYCRSQRPKMFCPPKKQECKVVVKSVAKAEVIIDAAFDEVISAVIKYIQEGGSLNEAKNIYKQIIITAIVKAFAAVEVKIEGDCENVSVEADARAEAVIKIINDVSSKKPVIPFGGGGGGGGGGVVAASSAASVRTENVPQFVSAEFIKAVSFAKQHA